jgi:hypothetical protein
MCIMASCDAMIHQAEAVVVGDSKTEGRAFQVQTLHFAKPSDARGYECSQDRTHEATDQVCNEAAVALQHFQMASSGTNFKHMCWHLSRDSGTRFKRQ